MKRLLIISMYISTVLNGSAALLEDVATQTSQGIEKQAQRVKPIRRLKTPPVAPRRVSIRAVPTSATQAALLGHQNIVDSYQQMIQKLENEKSALLPSQSEKAAKLDVRIAGLKNDMQKRQAVEMAPLQRQLMVIPNLPTLKEIQENVAVLKDTKDQLNQIISSDSSNISALQESLVAQDEQLARINKQFTQTNNYFKQIQSQIKRVQSKVASLKESPDQATDIPVLDFLNQQKNRASAGLEELYNESNQIAHERFMTNQVLSEVLSKQLQRKNLALQRADDLSKLTKTYFTDPTALLPSSDRKSFK